MKSICLMEKQLNGKYQKSFYRIRISGQGIKKIDPSGAFIQGSSGSSIVELKYHETEKAVYVNFIGIVLGHMVELDNNNPVIFYDIAGKRELNDQIIFPIIWMIWFCKIYLHPPFQSVSIMCTQYPLRTNIRVLNTMV